MGRQGTVALYFIMTLSFLLTGVSSARGRDYYLSSSTGSDANKGTALSPWKTLHKVSTTTLRPNDRVLLKKGDTWRESGGLVIAKPGSATKPIQIASYGTGTAKPLLNGSKAVTGWSGPKAHPRARYRGICAGLLEDATPIRKASGPELSDGGWYYDGGTVFYQPGSKTAAHHLVECCAAPVVRINSTRYVSLQDLEFYGSSGSGIWIVNSDHVQVSNCTARVNAGPGMAVANDPRKAGSPCSNIRMTGNRISQNATGVYLISENGAEGITNVDVIGNLIEYNDYRGVWGHQTKDGHGIGIQNTSGSHFVGNEIRYNRTGPTLWTATDRRSDNNVFARNFVHHNQRFGMAQGGEGRDNAAGNIWAFNIISDNGTGFDGGFRINRSQRGANLFVNNTLARNDIDFYLYSLTDFAVIKRNISYNPVKFHVLIEGVPGRNLLAQNLYYPDRAGLFGVGTQRTLDLAHWQYLTGLDRDCLVGDPLFLDAALLSPQQFIPAQASPALQGAWPLLPELKSLGAGDYFGHPLVDTASFLGAIKGP